MVDRANRRRALMPALLAAALLAAGCSGSSDAAVPTTVPSITVPSITVPPITVPPITVPPTTVPPTTVPPTTVPTTTVPPIELASGPSAGCDRPEPAALPTQLVTADGVRRTFRVVLPSIYDHAAPVPLVFDFHGLGSRGFQQALVSGVDFAADRAGYIAVIPDGAVNEVLETRLWNLTTAEGSSPLAGSLVDDVAFTVELLDLLESEFCIERGRVFSMGLSNGGFFSSVLACELADRIAAIATVAGITHPDGCEPVRPVPVLHFHGTADRVVPFDGGDSILTRGSDGVLGGLDDEQLADVGDELFQPIESEVEQWAETDGCAPRPEVIEVSVTVERRVFQNCDADVEFYVVEGGGHTWPGSVAMGLIPTLGLTTFDVRATELAFAWFDTHPMPAAS